MALLSVADALARVLEHARPLPAESVPLLDAMSRVLTDGIAARRSQPPADVSAMDGYAVRAADVATVPASLKVIGEVPAGHPFARPIKPGETARIFTGGFLPDGADTVVIQENTTRDGDVVVVNASAPPAKNVRRAGLDFRTGDVLLPAGHRLTARDLALAAAMNHPTLPVHRRPKVAMLATGDELVAPGTEPRPGQIVYSNGFAILGLARSEGADTLDLGVAPDRVPETVAAIRRAREAGTDVLVTSGGASVGDYDLVQDALKEEGIALSFWKIAMRPGRPMMHGRIGDMHVLGLPGNPVSAYVCAVLFLIPLLRRLSGRTDLTLPEEQARLGCDLPGNDEREDYLRARLEQDEAGRWIATPFQTQDSSMLAPLAQGGALVIRGPLAQPARAGEPCRMLRLAV